MNYTGGLVDHSFDVETFAAQLFESEFRTVFA